jgi:hypothetical protein
VTQLTQLQHKKLGWHWHSDGGLLTSLQRWKHARPRIWRTSGVGGKRWNVDQELPVASTGSVSLPVWMPRFLPLRLASFSSSALWWGTYQTQARESTPNVLSLRGLRTRGTKPPVHGAVLSSAHGQLYDYSAGFWHCTGSYWTAEHSTTDCVKQALYYYYYYYYYLKILPLIINKLYSSIH